MNDHETQIVADHKEIPAYNGPGYCTGCDWESRRIGISSSIQHREHVLGLLKH